MKTIILITLTVFLARCSSLAAPLTESTFTEIVNDVNTVSTSGNATLSQLNEILKAPERVRTGAQSRTELTAPDQTITRVGANTIFSFSDAGRTLNLEQGNLLFHAPKGLGGGTIKSGGASAAVLGTTLIVSATADGGFKVILLEGKGKVKLPGGPSATLHAGQLVFVLPGGKLSRVLTINLARLVNGSQLVNGFNHELSSMPLILAAIDAQNKLFKSGRAVDTGWPADPLAPPQPGNGLDILDPGTYQTAVPPLTSPSGVFLISTEGPSPPLPSGGRDISPVTPPPPQ